MIQPLHASRNAWALDWVELNEPIPSPGGFILPTCVFVAREASRPIVGQEILPELDQRRAENLLARLFSERGTPDEVLISDAPEWDRKAWKNFARDFNCAVHFAGANEDKPVIALSRAVKERVTGEMLEACRGTIKKERPAAIAKGLVRSAMALRSKDRRRAFLDKAAAIDPKNPSAPLELAELSMQSGNLKEALQLYSRVVDLESPRWEKFQVNWWHDADTRPFLRAIFGQMLVQWHKGRFEPAIESGERLLRINARDNQGVRFLLPMLYHLAEQGDKAFAFYERYEQRYPKDYMEPSFYFGWGLTLSQHEDETGAILRYRKGMLRNIYIAPMLLDLPEPRADIWLPNDRSEPAYAYEFFDSYAGLWERDTAVLRILREAYDQVAPDIEKLIELRTRMADFQDQRYDPSHDTRWKAFLEEERAIIGEGLDLA